VSSAFAFHFVCVRFGLQSAPTHHNHSLASGPIFGVRLSFGDEFEGFGVGVESDVGGLSGFGGCEEGGWAAGEGRLAGCQRHGAISDRQRAYTGPMGLKFVFDGVKASVKGQSGFSSAQYKSISGIKW
jgi:hypothetical protein